MNGNVWYSLKRSLSIVLTISLLLPNIAYANPLDGMLPTLQSEAVLSTPTTDLAVVETPEIGEPTAGIEPSQEAEAVPTTEDGIIKNGDGSIFAVHLGDSAGFTDEEAHQLLFGDMRARSSASLPSIADQVPWLTDDDVERGTRLHGSVTVLLRELRLIWSC